MFNFIEKFIIKRIAKKFINKIPSLKKKGTILIEKKADELFKKIEETIFNFIKGDKD